MQCNINSKRNYISIKRITPKVQLRAFISLFCVNLSVLADDVFWAEIGLGFGRDWVTSI